jgi:membrane protein implicated in regulation of membrane protease activity
LLAAIAAIPIVFLIIPHEIVIAVLFLMGILGFAALAMAQAYLYRKVFDQYIPQNEETKSEVRA